MKISMEEIGRIIETQNAGRSRVSAPKEGESPQSRTEPASTVEVSTRAQEIQRAKRAVDRLPDIREEMVQEMKARIDTDNYNLSGEDIADLIIRRSYADRIR